jgi:predicted HTH transcriptional regulator/NAD-dependent SIR2 family protein deacetylase
VKGFGHELGPDAVAALLRREAKPVFLLGAGASLKSGIPLAGTLVDAMSRFAYCKAHNRDPDDPTLVPSDWIRWVERQSWYDSRQSKASLYPLAVEHLLQPQSNRREFFSRILKPEIPPSDGYQRLATLMARRAVKTVLTTNFDDLVARTAKTTAAVPLVQEFYPEGKLDTFSTNPAYPQILYLHGSVLQYTDKNSLSQIETLDPAFPALLQPLLRDHALVVVGYRGMEPSIMRHLLIQQAERCGNFKEGIYWCHLPGSDPLQESAYLNDLAGRIATNLQFVQIEGFDELMRVLEKSSQPDARELWQVRAASREESPEYTVHDLRMSDITLDDLSETLLRSKLVEYASGMRLAPPELDSREQLTRVLLARNLARQARTEVRPTRGGQLLFARTQEAQLPQARVVVRVSGVASWVAAALDQDSSVLTGAIEEVFEITGDLWSQYDTASALLSRVNRPFRMKGTVSHSVYPYPPLALKELLTNLLAHRDYASSDPALITIERERIRFSNPGGLVEAVQRELEDESIQDALGGGVRAVKGYRNPVISDFFFFAGAMDKEGSGLPDVLREAANNLNAVEFGPSADNSKFFAAISCRPEALEVDEKTQTAKAQQAELRYSPNLLRIVSWPEKIRKLGTIATPRELGEANAAGAPPFGAGGEWLWTFDGIDSSLHPALRRACLEEESHVVPTAEFLSHAQAWSTVPRLLNAALARHLVSLGLVLKFEGARLRAYYPSQAGDPREIAYKSAFKQARRTVAKPIISRTSGKVVYWEHKAVSLRFENFGGAWALSLLPGYVFTTDGESRPIASERIGPLTTRRAARDYNPTVMHDLVFWARMISKGAETEFTIPVGGADERAHVLIAAMVPTFVFQEVLDAAVAEADESRTAVNEELDALQEEVEQAIAEGAEDEAADQ